MLSKIRFLAGLIALFLALVAVSWIWLQVYAVKPGSDSGERSVQIHIPNGTSLGGIKNILVERSVIRDDLRFDMLALILGYSDSLKAGHYSISPGATPLDILRRLEKGDVIRLSLTIPEGYTAKQIGKLLEERFGYEGNRFLELCRDNNLIESTGLEVKDLEGYLFPDTYQITLDTSLESLIRTMVKHFREVYTDLLPTRDLAATSALSRHEIVTMASIVEKETAMLDERPMVASVVINRLRRNMRLQVDPTVIYGLDKFGEVLNSADLAIDTPYNSYLHKGLPPGPICNPGRSALAAALNPDETSYLYFVSRNNGSHEFSRNLREHINAVNRFQR